MSPLKTEVFIDLAFQVMTDELILELPPYSQPISISSISLLFLALLKHYQTAN